MPERVDVVVIGGGIVGCAPAYYLARAGAGRVVLVEREVHGAGATGGSFYFHEDLARYRALGPGDVRAVAQDYLRDDAPVILSVLPQGRPDLAAAGPGQKGPP